MKSGSSAGLLKSDVYLSLTSSFTEKNDHLVYFAKQVVMGNDSIIEIETLEWCCADLAKS